MTRHHAPAGRDPRAVSETLISVAEIVDRLIAAIEAENRELARGLPASISIDGIDKARLAEELRLRMANGFDRSAIATASPELRERLIDRLRRLETSTQENRIRLEAAIGATRRRVAAVMNAFRQQANRGGPAYGANGRIPAAPRPSTAGRGRLA